ncbi:MAG: hypothetical protein JRJ45_10175, partial [Deltaproteobacteria bacterium]|nr:hypothetical protein [Deltaproteobacteria bacterium]
YSEKEWGKIAGNEFAYCNRLRASDYLALFKEIGFDVCRKDASVDYEARESMKHGFMIVEKFCGYSVDNLCGTQLKVALSAEGRNAGI